MAKVCETLDTTKYDHLSVTGSTWRIDIIAFKDSTRSEFIIDPTYFRNKRYGAEFVNAADSHSKSKEETALFGIRKNYKETDVSFISPDLTPSDYLLFPKMKNWIATQRFNDSEEFMDGVKIWLSTQAASFYEEGIHKLVLRYEKCLNLHGK
ncbi:hypothetical protein ANN_13367 [Periplaneta americana]|uniref:Uncharacterized protein n=1 Tax=Periplaneta americana TaxID=6978 RepID=A0ABQ8TMQ5_PERAM|nr:hypothetical protein ANN_13367 [Periplaneta americana]